ncbi:hypothetical protein C0Q70_10099 [Pomacea canaliculata]|uniref:Uncharacterized protein n=1 Tax=Pomacea canaliculata TaxID=400727 RepID=A0A2T7PBM7_POMCA|nr:hypothetical protein C0Q70_10099 [Pomacea canaliculata]
MEDEDSIEDLEANKWIEPSMRDLKWFSTDHFVRHYIHQAVHSQDHCRELRRSLLTRTPPRLAASRSLATMFLTTGIWSVLILFGRTDRGVGRGVRLSHMTSVNPRLAHKRPHTHQYRHTNTHAYTHTQAHALASTRVRLIHILLMSSKPPKTPL